MAKMTEPGRDNLFGSSKKIKDLANLCIIKAIENELWRFFFLQVRAVIMRKKKRIFNGRDG
jgi:hypothetical protein